MSLHLFVAVQYTDNLGVHRVGDEVTFPNEARRDVENLVAHGILSVGPISDDSGRPVEAVTLPEPTSEPTEGVKKVSARRKPAAHPKEP